MATAQNALTTKIQILPNSIEFLQFTYKGITLEKQAYNNSFYLQSVEDAINSKLHDPIVVTPFLNSYMFYAELSLFDPSLTLYKDVYIMKFEEDHTFKIGNTYNYRRRYPVETRQHLIKSVPVRNPTAVENALIRYYTDHYEIAHGREYFKYGNDDNFPKVLLEFNNIVSQYSVNAYDYKKSSHMMAERISDDKRGKWVSSDVCKILINKFINNEDTLKDFNDMFRLIELSYREETYEEYKYNKSLRTRCLYWKFHKYTVIQNESDKYINGSRLFNSIKKAEGLKSKKNLKRYLQSQEIQRLREQCYAKYGKGTELYYYDNNTEQPYLSGFYVHYILVHHIVNWLSAEYAFVVGELMYKMFRSGSTAMSGGGAASDTSDKEEYINNYLRYGSNVTDIDKLCTLFGI